MLSESLLSHLHFTKTPLTVNLYSRAFQLKWTVGRTHVSQVYRRATWRKIRWFLYILQRILNIRLMLATTPDLLGRKLLYSAFLFHFLQLTQVILLKCIWLPGPQSIASRATCDPWAAGWKALLYSVEPTCLKQMITYMNILPNFPEWWAHSSSICNRCNSVRGHKLS